MVAISQGKKTKDEMVQRNIALYREIFLHVKSKAEKLDQVSVISSSVDSSLINKPFFTFYVVSHSLIHFLLTKGLGKVL
jgi:hypothetical protein